MRKVWVLDTETKGTGAEMVPLEKVLEKGSTSGRGVIVPREPAPRPAEPAGPKTPPRFKVVDVMTRQVLAEAADTRAAGDLVAGGPHLFERAALRVGQVPVEVALARDVGALVAAAHRDHDIRRLRKVSGEHSRGVVGEIEAELPHRLHHLWMHTVRGGG